MRDIFLEDSTGECLYDIGVGKDFLNSTKSTKYSREKKINQTTLILKTSIHPKTPLRERKGKQPNGRRH